jgi:predicted dehydrogenase
VEYHGGKIAYFFASRMMAHGQHDMTEIIGTNGSLAVNANPQINLVEIRDHLGIRKEVPQDYYGRFEMAFVNEANEFTAAVLDDMPVPITLTSAYKALEIGAALQESLVTGVKLEFDAQGKRLTPEKLKN